jgi:hypothetical protein
VGSWEARSGGTGTSAAIWLTYAPTVDPCGRPSQATEEHDPADRQASNPALDVLAIPFYEPVPAGAISPFNNDHKLLQLHEQGGRAGPRVYVD